MDEIGRKCVFVSAHMLVVFSLLPVVVLLNERVCDHYRRFMISPLPGKVPSRGVDVVLGGVGGLSGDFLVDREAGVRPSEGHVGPRHYLRDRGLMDER